MKSFKFFVPLVMAAVAAAGHPVQAQTGTPVFTDEFNSGQFDAGQWRIVNGTEHLQRTQWGAMPTFGSDADGTRFMRVGIQTYNPDSRYTGKEMVGTEVASLRDFNVGAGLEYEARMRAANLPSGLVLGYFAYGDAGAWTSTYQKTESDYEFLSTQSKDSIWLNIWDDWNPERGGPNSATLTRISGLNWNSGAWVVDKIRWFPTKTEWWVNNTLARTETTVKPASPMGVWFNLWAATSDWDTAYSSSLVTAGTPAQNKSYFFDVDYVRVRTIPATGTAVWGTGTGLNANYYDNANFSGASVSRIDPRINFNWGNYAPDARLGADTFSARWTGQVQAQYTQDYTFYAKTDDGVRLWVNNNLIIDNWKDQGATEKASTRIRLTAGVKVPIKVEYYDNTGGASAQLSWSSSSTAKQLVPQSQLYPDSTVGNPVFSPVSGSYAAPLSVTITSPTAGATIRYTVNGTEPTEASPSIPSGGNVPLTKTTTILARAYLAGSGGSEMRAGVYTLTQDAPDTTKPTVSIGTPANAAWLKSFGAISGAAADNAGGSGLSRVTLVIKRTSDSLSWNGSAWVAGEFGLGTSLSGTAWSYAGPFPVGASLTEGAYQLKANAYDKAGNLGSAAITANIDLLSATVTITSQAAGGSVTGLTSVSGTAKDRGIGSGVLKVDFTLIRKSDGFQWNGYNWVNYNTGMATNFSGQTWSVSNGSPTAATLPSGAKFPDGSYDLKAVAYDKAGYTSVAVVTITKVSGASALAVSVHPF